MRALSVYLPMDRRQVLAAGNTLPERTRGALLFADVSGFTSMTMTFFKELGGLRGAEVVTRHLNQVYDALITQLYNYRGSVIAFSGDAITCWIDGDSGRMATACALAMQRAVDDLGPITTAAGTTIPLGIKVVVTAGPVRRHLVGKEEIQRIEVLVGRDVDRLGEAEQEMNLGEVMVGAEVLASLGDAAHLLEQRASSTGELFAVISGLTQAVEVDPWPEEPELPAEITRPWLLPPVQQRLERGEGDFLAEMRSVVTLFLNFRVAGQGEGRFAGEQLDAFVGWAQTIVEGFGGYLLQVTIGDKGSYLQAVFGAPVSHGDDARRGVEAALALQSLPADLSYVQGIKIGISQGMVWAGAYGGRLRKSYGVMGNEVNVGARLMSNAKSEQILVTSRIAGSVDGEFHSLGRMALKGLTDPIPVFTVAGRRSTPAIRAGHERSPVPLIGRQPERDWLNGHLQALLDGQGGRLLVEGEPGIGKSRLVSELIEQAGNKGVCALYAAADAIEQSRAYHAWIAPVYEIMGVEQGDLAALREQVTGILADEARLAERASLLNTVFPLGLPENDLTRQMDADVRASNTRELLVYLLARAPCSAARWLLVMDDIQWLDSASWALLEQVWRDIPDLLLVMVSRQHAFGTDGKPAPPEYTRLAQNGRAERLQLTTLTAEEAELLVCSHLGVRRLAAQIGELIYRRAEGHPFYTVEFASALLEAGHIQVLDGEARLAAEAKRVDELDFPRTIQGVITSRIDRLAPVQQLTLKVASVIGRVFPFNTLWDIYPVPSDRPKLGGNLRTLERLEITMLEAPEPDPAYAFKHMIIREVAYSMLPQAQQNQLHLAIAELLEEGYQDELSRYFPLLAHHWFLAIGDIRTANPKVLIKALAYLDKAGLQAQEQFAEREAIGYFMRAMKLAEAMEKRPDGGIAHESYESLAAGTRLSPSRLHRASWALQLGDSYLGLGLLSESRHYYEQALSLYKYPVVRSRTQLVLNLLVQSVRQLAHRVVPGPLTRRREKLDRNENQRLLVLNAVRAYERLMKVFYYANEGGLFVNAGLTGLNLAETAGPSADLTRIYANMASVAGIIPLHGLAKTYGRLAMETAQIVDQSSALGWVLTSTSVYNVGICNWDAAQQALTEATAIYERLGDHRQYEESLAVALTALYYQSKFERSAGTSGNLYASASRRDDPQTQAWGLLGLVENYLRLDRLDEALPLLDSLESLLTKQVGLAEQIWIYGLLALTRWRAGDREAALEAAGKGRELILNSTPTAVYTLEGFADIVEVYLENWRAEAKALGTNANTTRRPAKQMISALRGFARTFPVGRPSAWRYRGNFNWLAGKPSQAQKAWQNGLASAAELAMPYEAGMAHLEMGRHLDLGDPERHSHLLQAKELLAKTGALYDLARANKALNGSS